MFDEPGVLRQAWTYVWDREDAGYSLLSAPIVVAVPADATAISVTLEHDGVITGFDRVLFNGIVVASSYEEPALTVFDGDLEASTFLMPNNERTRLAEGCLVIEPYAAGRLQGEEFTVTVVMRRAAPGVRLDLNVAIMDGTEIDDGEIEAALVVVDEVYATNNAPSLGSIDLYDVEGPNVVDAEGAELNDVRSIVYDAPDRMNIILVSSFTEVGTLGIASGIPAPPFSGTVGSGLVIAVDEHLDASGTALDTRLLGETIAHELGHMMGLYHTTEDNGADFDVIADTARCPGSADVDGDGEYSAEECRDWDGANLMFWVAGDFSQSALSPMQAEVLSAYPISQ